MTDAEFMLETLRAYGTATTMQIIERSIHQRGCGITPHSRAADLRRLGHDVQCERAGSHNGRPVWSYRLITEPVQLCLEGAA